MNTDLYWIMNTGHLMYDWIQIVLLNHRILLYDTRAPSMH